MSPVVTAKLHLRRRFEHKIAEETIVVGLVALELRTNGRNGDTYEEC